MIEILKAILFGIVEGVTEWLPISSTGHLILLDEFVVLNVSAEFKSMFDVVIQHGSGHRGGCAVLCAGAVCSDYQLHRPDRERCLHL